VAETEKERIDRELIELLNELRVALPGVQILFGFLLTVPFAQGFKTVTTFQRDTYFATLLLTAGATACLIAPSAAHRIRFHQSDRPWLIAHANRMLIGGLVFMALALVGVTLLITDYLFDAAAPFVFPAVLAVALAVLWFVRPLMRG
jgi:hypothetical protein